MKTQSSFRKCGFTLIETVIAIGVLAVLLTGFIIVFAPAAAGIKNSVNLQAADRLASTLEQELVTLRKGQESADITTGFDKAFDWIQKSKGGSANDAILAYQYRGSLTDRRDDDTPTPVAVITGQVSGKDYLVQSMLRRKNDAKFSADVKALEGGIYLVKCTQFVFDENGGLVAGTAGEINNPKPNSTPPDPAYKPGPFGTAAEYPEAVIAFSAEFFSVPQRTDAQFGANFEKTYTNAKKPVFTRNLAVRR